MRLALWANPLETIKKICHGRISFRTDIEAVTERSPRSAKPPLGGPQGPMTLS